MDTSTGTGSGTDPNTVPLPPADRVVSEGSPYRARAGIVTSPTMVS